MALSFSFRSFMSNLGNRLEQLIVEARRRLGHYLAILEKFDNGEVQNSRSGGGKNWAHSV